MRIHFIWIFILVSFPFISEAQIEQFTFSAHSYTKHQIGVASVSLDYYRPSGNGEKIFGEKIPWYEYWFTGEYHSTTITFSEDVLIDDQFLAKGSYSILTKPDPGFWEVIFYSELNLKQLPEPIDENKVSLRVELDMEEYYYGQETFGIYLEEITPNGATLFFVWDDFYAELPFEFPETLKQVEALLTDNSSNTETNTLYEAARYLYYIEDEPTKALKLLDKAIKKDGKNAYFHFEKAVILQEEGEEKAALKSAKLAKRFAQPATQKTLIKNIHALLEEIEE